ncbi:MAG: hypothetical protein JNK82_37695 [Myxococcaceae bacterium]|nr:hypothetical protein [Myxococcaceae bacterium]
MTTGKVGPRASAPTHLEHTRRTAEPEHTKSARKGFRGSSKFEAHRPAADRPSLQLDSTRGVEGIDAASDAQALTTQRELSAARQQLGQLQQRRERQPVLMLDLATDRQIAQLQEKVSALEKLEASQPEKSVLKARFTVFNERMGELEKTLGKSQAATIARQTYYNGPTWNAPSGTMPATIGAINAAGLPHGKFNPNIAAGGFEGEMMTPDGKAVDMGHVSAALDWQVNRHLGLSEGEVTVVGDLGSAMRNTSSSSPSAKAADEALDIEGPGDWNGDLDGQNLANRMRQNPNLSITDALKGYYGTGDHKNRVNEWASHSPYIVRNADGRPALDREGNFQFTPQLKADSEAFLKKLTLYRQDPKDKDGQGVIDAFGRYLAANRK